MTPVAASAERAAWRTAYDASRGGALITSTVGCAVIIPPIVASMTAYMVSVEPGTLAVRTWLGALYVVACAATLALRQRAGIRRHATAFALTFVLAIAAIAIVYWRLLPQTDGGAISSLLVIQMGTALLFPWGAAWQAVVCAALAAGYGWLVHAVPETFQPFSAGLLVTTAPLMVLAAHLVDRYRATAFEREWQKDQIASLARALGTRLDRAALGASVLAHGMRLLGADGGSLAVRVPERRAFRIEAVDVPDSPWLGYELGEDVPVVQQIGAAGVFVLPGDDPAHPFLSFLKQEGKTHALYAALREGHELIGVVSFVRAADRPFSDADRGLARAVADQAALALRTATVVQDLRRANQLKTEFVSTMSHELRTPLNVILGYAEMARDCALEPADRDDCLDRIVGAGRDLLTLIESTLEIGKLEAGRMEVRAEPVPLPAFLDQLAETCGRIPRADGVVLEWSRAVPALTVETDARKLDIVVRNLVGNALKFTERGAVSVEVCVEPARIGLRIRDTGIGIRAEDRDSIFEMFRQADGSDTRRYGGVGLGLYIVRRFVDQLGGTIELDSTPGVGTTFTVWLPRGAVRELSAVA